MQYAAFIHAELLIIEKAGKAQLLCAYPFIFAQFLIIEQTELCSYPKLRSFLGNSLAVKTTHHFSEEWSRRSPSHCKGQGHISALLAFLPLPMGGVVAAAAAAEPERRPFPSCSRAGPPKLAWLGVSCRGLLRVSGHLSGLFRKLALSGEGERGEREGERRQEAAAVLLSWN